MLKQAPEDTIDYTIWNVSRAMGDIFSAPLEERIDIVSVINLIEDVRHRAFLAFRMSGLSLAAAHVKAYGFENPHAARVYSKLCNWIANTLNGLSPLEVAA